MLGWMYLVALTLLVLSKGRPYYLSPAYPVLIAAGARGAEERLQKLPESIGRILRYAGNGTLSVGAVCIVALTLPLAPVNTGWWKVTSSLNDNLKEEVGWPELVTTVAKVYHNLSGSGESANRHSCRKRRRSRCDQSLWYGLRTPGRDQRIQFLMGPWLRKSASSNGDSSRIYGRLLDCQL